MLYIILFGIKIFVSFIVSGPCVLNSLFSGTIWRFKIPLLKFSKHIAVGNLLNGKAFKKYAFFKLMAAVMLVGKIFLNYSPVSNGKILYTLKDCSQWHVAYPLNYTLRSLISILLLRY